MGLRPLTKSVAGIAAGILCAVVCLGTSVIVLLQAQQAIRRAEDVRNQVAAKIADLAGDASAIQQRMDSIAAEQGKTASVVSRYSDTRERERELLQADLRRFSSWAETENNRIRQQQQELIGRIDQLQKEMDQQKQLVVSLRQPSSAASTSAVSTVQAAASTSDVPAKSSGDLQKASLVLPGGDRYEGGVISGIPEGQGMMIYSNGNQYSGQFRGGKKSGQGIFRFANGDRYEGDFIEDQRQGKGVYFYRDGSRYEGEFRNGLRNGKGHYFFRDGGEFTGSFKDGRKHGWGVYLFPDGTKMEGFWEEDRYKGTSKRQ